RRAGLGKPVRVRHPRPHAFPPLQQKRKPRKRNGLPNSLGHGNFGKIVSRPLGHPLSKVAVPWGTGLGWPSVEAGRRGHESLNPITRGTFTKDLWERKRSRNSFPISFIGKDPRLFSFSAPLRGCEPRSDGTLLRASRLSALRRSPFPPPSSGRSRRCESRG